MAQKPGCPRAVPPLSIAALFFWVATFEITGVATAARMQRFIVFTTPKFVINFPQRSTAAAPASCLEQQLNEREQASRPSPKHPRSFFRYPR